jgi:tripartite-type tricarboxylate transporter receptor subunit TctC
VDNSTRLLASAAEKFLGQPFVVTNNSGGAGSVGFGIVAKEKPDGYHLIGSQFGPLIWNAQFRTVTYKLEDFIPILQHSLAPIGLVVRADSPWKTLKEFVEYAKQNPGKVTYTAIGTGSPQHLAMEYIAKQEGIQWILVPYPGGDPNYPLLGGHVTACSSGPALTAFVKAGSLRLLAAYGERRMKVFPEVPTLRELGYDFIETLGFSILAPKGTPPSIVRKLEDAFRKGMDNSEFIRYVEKVGMEVSYRNSEDTKKFLEEAYVRAGKMVKELKIPKEPEKK